MYPIRPRVSDNSLRRPCSCLLYMSSPIGDRYAVCRIFSPACVYRLRLRVCVRASACLLSSTKFPPSMCGAEDICAQPQEKNFPSIAAAFFFIFALLELAHMRRDHGPAHSGLRTLDILSTHARRSCVDIWTGAPRAGGSQVDGARGALRPREEPTAAPR